MPKLTFPLINACYKKHITIAIPPSKILIFDSGLGGISILREVKQARPDCQTIYCSDNQAFPYGSKPERELVARIDLVLTCLVNRFSPDIIVIACNTASTVALPLLRSKLKQPVIGVVPAIKPAATRAKTQCIGLLATPGTVERSYTQALIDQFGAGLNDNPLDWIKVGSSDLVCLIESNLFSGKPFPSEKLALILQPFIKKDASELDTIVLACTHFPLIIDELKATLPHVKNWIDSGKAISARVEFILNELGHRKQATLCDDHCLVLTEAITEGDNDCGGFFNKKILAQEGLTSTYILALPG